MQSRDLLTLSKAR